MSFSSDFSKQLASNASIVDLMNDLGDALNVNPSALFLGGGNPARVPGFETLAAKHLQEIANDRDELHKLLGIYQSPQGSERLIESLTTYLRQRGWPVSERNICVTSGSQTAFFTLFNLLGGQGSTSSLECNRDQNRLTRKICLPIVPEYLGYADQGLTHDMFYSVKPEIELIDDHSFKYRIDFDALEIDDSVAALCVSRPTNPSANMISDSELEQLGSIAMHHSIPLIVDCAYGAPFPGLVYGEGSTCWRPGSVYVMSLSKLGMPGARAAVVIADEPLIETLVSSNTVISLASGNLGPALLDRIIRAGELDTLCEEILIPFYQRKRAFAMQALASSFEGINYRVHKSEGAFFLWLWFPDLRVSARELYRRLKNKNVLVMDGEHFFFEHARTWEHAQQCIRITFCADDQVLAKAIEIIAEEIRCLSD